MDVREYLRIFARYWWLIVVFAVLGGAIGYSTWAFPGVIPYTDREYQSTATLFVATQNGTSVAEAYQNNLFSTDRANSYATLATSEQVAARAVDELKAPISAGELRSKITAATSPKTVLLNVSVTDPDPFQAQTYANAVADQLVGLVSELETSRRGGSPAAGVVVVDEAGYPTAPEGMGMFTRIALGAVAGLVLGILLSVLVGVLDRRLRGRETVEESTGSLVIGALPLDPERPKIDAVDLASGGLYAERLRELRTNLRFIVPANGERPPRLIAITSPSGQDGRTTVAIDLAAALAESGRSVILVDGDLRNPAMADRLGLFGSTLDDALARGLSTVLVGETALGESVIPNVAVGGHTIGLLPAGPTPLRPGELWASDRAASVFDDLIQQYEYVIVDTPPLDDYSDGAVAAALSDGALLLARIRRTTSSRLRRALRSLQAAHVALIGTVVTGEPGHRGQLRRGNRRGDDAARGQVVEEADDGGDWPDDGSSGVGDSGGSGATAATGEDAAAGTSRAQPRHGSR